MATPIRPLNRPVIVQLKDDFETLFADIDDDNTWKGATKQKDKVAPEATFSEDPVALSVTSYLIWKNNPARRWTSINEVGRPTPEARELAHEIRKYYLHRGTMKVLMGHEHTEFQHKMLSFLADTRALKTDELGILYRLPYFYQEDLALDLVFESATDIKDDSPGLFQVTTHATLNPVREILRSRRGGDHYQFWFADADNQRYVYDVKADNKLLSIFRSLFRQPELKITAYSKLERLKGSHVRTKYWRLSNLELQ